MANALESASLVMIPSGYEDGTLGSLKPTDGTGDFTFSRGSNTSATRINEQGYIEKGYENTLLASNDFARDDSSYTITSGEQGYDGTTDAWLVNKLVTGNAYFGKNGSVYTGVMTISFHLKAGTLDRLAIITTGDYVVFDLANVTATKFGGAPITQTIELVSGTTDWYRCSMVINRNETNNILLKPYNTSNQDAAGTIYIQDAMLNQGLLAYPYIETTTAPVAGGILEDMPRLDYSNGSCPALLLEPQRTNAIAHSEYIGNTTNSTISRNDGVSPEGVENASKVTITGTSQAGITTSNAYVSLSTTYTQSCYVKKDVGDYFGFGLFQLGMPINNNNYVRWNLSDINATPSIQGSYTNAKAEDAGNGWIRLSATIITTSSSTRSGWKFLGMTSSNNFQTSAVGDSFYLYGLQAEPDATYPTSYIPTYGVSQTRLGDSMQSDTSSFGITNEFTLFIDVNAALVDGTSLNQMGELRWYTQATNRYRFYKSSNAIFISNNIQVDDRTKIALKITASECKTFVDGVLDSTISLPTSFASFDLISRNMETKVKEELKQMILFPTALSDSECIALTTI